VNSVSMDDLFEYKLSKPITITKGSSVLVPLLQTEVQADRVTVWNAHGMNRPMRAVWLKNTSELTLDRGSFSVMENGMFGGQGQLDLLHTNQRQMLPYAADEAVTVKYVDTKNPTPVVSRIQVTNGTMSVHRRLFTEINYSIENMGATSRSIVIERAVDPKMNLAPETPAAEVTDTLHRFQVEAPANKTTKFRVLESHAHPDHYDLHRVKADELEKILKESKSNAEVAANLQPLIDAKKKIVSLDKKLETTQKAMDEVKAEEKRIRENIEPLKGSGEGQALSKRYSDEMNAQEDKMAALVKQRDVLREERGAVEKDLSSRIDAMTMNTTLVA
jgi:hypothetical protein